MTTLRTAAKDATKRKFLDSALTVIRSQGYSATSIDDLCLSAGATKGAFFHHFRSKEQLGVDAAQHFAAMADSLFRAAPYQSLSDPVERLLGYIDFRIAILKGPMANFTCLLGTMVQEAYDTHEPIRAACQRHMAEHIDMLVTDIELAKAQYAPDADWTPLSLGYHIQSVIQGGFIYAKANQSAQVIEECLRHLRRYIEMLFADSNPDRQSSTTA